MDELKRIAPRAGASDKAAWARIPAPVAEDRVVRAFKGGFIVFARSSQALMCGPTARMSSADSWLRLEAMTC